MTKKVENQPGAENDGKEGTKPPEGGEPNKSKPDGEGNPAPKGDDESGELDVAKLDPKVQKIIKDLREENARSRTRNKELAASHGTLKKALIEAGVIENDEEKPEEKIKTLSAVNQESAVKNAILEAAIEHGVGKEDLKYFHFLVAEKVASLEDEDELGEEEIAALAKQARRSKAPGSTSVTPGEGKGTPPPGAAGTVTLDQFVKMNMGEKTDLYVKNQALYSQLIAEAKTKRMLV